MSKQEKLLPVQNIFLENIKESKKVVEIHLINGILLKCKILNMDNFSLLVDLNLQAFYSIHKINIIFLLNFN